MREMNDYNRRLIEEFRAYGGKVSGYFEHTPLLLLTTTGARSGERRTTPMGYLPDGDRLIVFAANGGSPTNPDWYHNLVVLPQRAWSDNRVARDRMMARRLGKVEQARGDHLSPPERIEVNNVLAHALDHLAMLSTSDERIIAVLESGWRGSACDKDTEASRLCRGSDHLNEAWSSILRIAQRVEGYADLCPVAGEKQALDRDIK
jgi:deazaflavin-dependent oxidoreductase (nitroreductase family)